MWKPHYTGIETKEQEWRKFNLYRQRNTFTGELMMIRLSWPKHMVGLFLGNTNYVKGANGWELFTSRHHVGWAKRTFGKFVYVEFSGSMREPYTSFTLRIGRLGVGGRSPKWLVARKHAQDQKRWDAMCGPDEE